MNEKSKTTWERKHKRKFAVHWIELPNDGQCKQGLNFYEEFDTIERAKEFFENRKKFWADQPIRVSVLEHEITIRTEGKDILVYDPFKNEAELDFLNRDL
jgi:hypothetical protein